uniref:Uncharacterized protein n=1 Tax=Panagrolaimus sp. JU765 TaxID=591449 RepID=A0AC34R204_9BILA
MVPIIFLLIFAVSQALRTPCADQTQRCGILIEDFEKQIQDMKSLAFRKCFIHPACLQEKIAFDDCYSRALRAVRASYNGETSPNDGFFDSSERFRAQIEQCLGGADRMPFDVDADAFHQENVMLEETVFSTELSDRMWHLPENGTKFRGSCAFRDFGRIFGNGISRILDSSKISINNLNTSCVLRQSEVDCYRKTLDEDGRFQQMLKQKEQTLQNCVKSVRLQSHCRGSESPRLKECLCEAKEEFNNRLQATLLECTRKSDIGKLYAELLERGIDQSKLNPDAAVESESILIDQSSKSEDSEPKTLNKHRYHQSSQQQTVTNTITQGTMLGGQCLCACPSIASGQSFSSYSDQFVQKPPSTVANVPSQTAGVPSYAATGYKGYYPSYSQYYSRSSIVDPITAVEMGISDGFGRFFKGQPPPIR